MTYGEELSLSDHGSKKDKKGYSEDIESQDWPPYIFSMINMTIFCFGFQMMLVLPCLLPIIEQFVTKTHGSEYFQENKGVLMQLLISSWYLANCLGSLVWGRASDRWGRRPILLISLSCTSLAMFAMAISTSYTQMLIARTVGGFFDSTLFNSKTAMGDVCASSKFSQREKKFGYLMGWFALGLSLGPLLGVELLQRGNGLVDNMPGLLPFAVFSALLATICFIEWIFFPETSHRYRSQQVLVDLESCEDQSDCSLSNGLRKIGWFEALAQRDVAFSIIMYASLVLLLTGSEMLVPLLTKEDVSKHGLGLDDSWVGFFFSFQGGVHVFSQLFIYPKISELLNPVAGLRFSLAVLTFLIPGGFSPSMAPVGPWPKILMTMVMSIRVLIVSIALTSAIVCIDNSATSATKGTVNGATQALASLTRCAGALSAGVFFDFGRRSFTIFFPYAIFGVIMFCAWILTWLLPSSLANPRLEVISERKCKTAIGR